MGVAESDDDEILVSLNMEHPANAEMVEFVRNNTPEIVGKFFARMMRRSEFDRSMESIGGLTKHRRKMVVRSLIRMFRCGYSAGHMEGWRHAMEKTEATDGR